MEKACLKPAETELCPFGALSLCKLGRLLKILRSEYSVNKLIHTLLSIFIIHISHSNAQGVEFEKCVKLLAEAIQVKAAVAEASNDGGRGGGHT